MGKKLQNPILIVDDDTDILLTARMVLKQRFSDIKTTSDPHKISDILSEGNYDLVLLDMNFTAGFTSGKEGLRWLKKIKKTAPQTHVVLMTAYGDINLAVKAMKEGATDFVVKPWENEALVSTVMAAVQGPPKPPSPKEENPDPPKSHTSPAGIPVDGRVIIGESPAMKQVFRMLDKVATTDANVLVLGENGTGKELVARALHDRSQRKDRPFVHVDLGAIPESLFESELFGHVKGAFTDAREDRAGRFEAADGGTLFLDEIGNLSLSMQAKLLTALQSRMIVRVGSNRPVKVDIRLVCATNMPLYEMVREKEFRQDLLYRINTVEVILPPLRERIEDIPPLVEHYLQIYREKYQREGFSVPHDILNRLKSHRWPGNIRELQHALERAVIMEDTESLLPEVGQTTGNAPDNPQDYNLEEVEKHAIRQAISKHNGNISKAAKELGLGRTTLYRKMNKYGL
ncbi:sigma-54 dependent transcriptional regulator [Pontibacter sp. G13]|uniref:sigma-54-dependent transcriptional regulator n=1 Tax=Pontibacter sp. G13 TaxID=3074898 RepID=UPI00288A5340|nr:sigma-54 dependent transcriptional regulator [Pontibacter sp. G13]WNJ18952.1 sigma-54 dependent transcriptional regulator [Pontibacter sp. G13]